MQNKKIGKSGERHIYDDYGGGYNIRIQRNKINYLKYLPKTSTIGDAIIQRDLMLSMF